MGPHVAAEPYAWPYDGDLRPENTAFVIIDMQVDFCGKGGYVDLMGYDLSLTRAPIEPIKNVLSACRKLGYTVIHTREGHRPDLSDLPPNKRWRSEQIGAGIGTKGPCGRVLVRGEPGWEIIPELAPIEGEPIIDKPGKGSFYATDLELVLRTRKIRNIILAGITTDVCVHTTMRDANDMGFECLLLSDCTGATDPGNHAAALKMVKMQGGVFGAVASSTALLQVMTPSAQPMANGLSGSYIEISSRPYTCHWPLKHTALVMVDMQRDFLMEGGFASALGNDVSVLQSCMGPAHQLLQACREAGLTIVHTLECHEPDMSDVPANKLTGATGAKIGDPGPMGRILIKGEYGNELMDMFQSVKDEKVVYKPGKGAFYRTDLDVYLRSKGITHLLFAGVTTDVCVNTSMREANDRGYYCLVVDDACGSYNPHYHNCAIEVLISQNGIVGCAASAQQVVDALKAVASSE